MSLDNAYFSRLPVDRYGLPMNRIMIHFINIQNNRDIAEKQFWFGVPEPFGPDGLIKLPVKFSEDSGWDTATTQYIEYKRQFITDVLPEGQFTIHIPADAVTDVSIVAALFSQYGLFLDTDTFTLTETDVDGIPIPPPTEITGEDRWFSLAFLNTHILLEGEIPVRIVASIAALGTTISRLMDIRHYYKNPNADKFPTELYTRQLVMEATPEQGQFLYYIGDELAEITDLSCVLKTCTGDDWSESEFPTEFNCADYTLVYNGLRTELHSDTNPEYPYVLTIHLSEELCTNLQGPITISYRNDRKKFPGYVGGRDIRPVAILRT